MRKKLFLFSALIIGFFSADAQINTQFNALTNKIDEPAFGVRAVLNLSVLAGSTHSGYSPASSYTQTATLPGFSAGVYVNLPVSTKFSFEPGLDYSIKGAASKADNTDKLSLNYIVLPVLFKWNPNGRVGFTLGLGPEFGYLVSASEIYRNETGNKARLNETGLYRKFDLGLDLDIGYNFLTCFGADIRSCSGLTNIINKNYSTDSNGGTQQLKNANLQLGIHYLFGQR